MGWHAEAPREERRFDQTYLRENAHGQTIHRDYIAHCMRWAYATKSAEGKRVLDVGCGPEKPLMKVLFRNADPADKPVQYVGVDLNKVKPTTRAGCTIHSEFNFLDDDLSVLGAPFDLVCCYEVIEHMGPEDGLKLLRRLREMTNGQLHLSTPVLGHKQARNHIHEYEIDELYVALAKAGFTVMKRFGTFANLPAIIKVATKEECALLKEMREFMDDHVAACFLAWKYPDSSRNNLWICS